MTPPGHTDPGTEETADGWLATTERRLATTVALDGYHVIAIPPGDATALAYTVGLWRSVGHPELAVAGLEPPVAAQLLHLLAAEVARGARFAPGDRPVGFPPGVAFQFRGIDARTAADCLRLAARFHRPGGFAALQTVWPDLDGRFPGEPGCDPQVDGRQFLLRPRE